MFSHTEDYIFSTDEQTFGIASWDTRLGTRNPIASRSLDMSTLSSHPVAMHFLSFDAFLTCTFLACACAYVALVLCSGHNQPIRAIAFSPVEPCFITCRSVH